MSPISKAFVSSFILLNFLIMFRVHLPLDTRFFKSMYRPIDKYLSFFTLHQSWNMYSPNPLNTNAYLTADVEFDDGTKATYEFPRIDRMTIFEKSTYGERMRVMLESIRMDKNQFLWKDAAKFALRKLKKENFYKIPMKVNLNRHWNTIPDPKQDFRSHLFRSQDYQKYTFYTYEVL